MAVNTRPETGSYQPPRGRSHCWGTSRALQRPKAPSPVRDAVAENIRALLDLRFAEAKNKPRALAREADCSLSTIQRICSTGVGLSLDTMDRIAQSLGVAVYQLVLPGLDAGAPQAVVSQRLPVEKIRKDLERLPLAERAKLIRGIVGATGDARTGLMPFEPILERRRYA